MKLISTTFCRGLVRSKSAHLAALAGAGSLMAQGAFAAAKGPSADPSSGGGGGSSCCTTCTCSSSGGGGGDGSGTTSKPTTVSH